MRPATLSAVLPRIALFSDVDGTLLDGNNRLVLDAGDVARITSRAELILASSRTLVELAAVQRRLGMSGPMIAENGAVVAFPAHWRGSTEPRRTTVVLGDRAVTLVPLIHRCAAHVGVRVVNQKHLLPDRGKSLRRGYSVCLRDWTGESAENFLRCLTSVGLEATRSGRWITITSGPDKGTGARVVLDRARELRAPFRTTVAIGNAANDVPLLAAATLRLAIRNPRHGHQPELLDVPRVKPLSSSGKRAWREALAAILSNGRP